MPNLYPCCTWCDSFFAMLSRESFRADADIWRNIAETSTTIVTRRTMTGVSVCWMKRHAINNYVYRDNSFVSPRRGRRDGKIIAAGFAFVLCPWAHSLSAPVFNLWIAQTRRTCYVSFVTVSPSESFGAGTDIWRTAAETFTTIFTRRTVTRVECR